MKLINPTDDQINAAVAEHVAGIKYRKVLREVWAESGCAAFPTGEMYEELVPEKIDFTYSMDAVLPLLEKCVRINIQMLKFWGEEIEWGISISDKASSRDKSLPRAACIALLRANDVEVEFST